MGHDEELTAEQIDLNISPLSGAFGRTWNSFCATSSIHGLKYTRDEDTNRIVRFVWILISLVMFICAIIMVHTFYIDYRSNPTRMNVENDHTPVTTIYFPPVTICPEVLFNTQQSKAFLQTLKLPDATQVKNILDLLHIFHGFMVDDNRYSQADTDLLESVLALNNLTIEQFVDRMLWNCNDLIHRCRYQGIIVDCSQLFQRSKTFYGHCCSFNLRQFGLNFTARYAAGGLENGLSLVLRYKDDSYDILESYSNGFKMLMQEALTYPSAHSLIKFMPQNTEVFAAVRPEETFCSSAVKALPIEERNCVFQDEVKLRYFRKYMYINCELNCRVTNMVKFCGCYTYFFNLNRTNERICSFRDVHCLVENFDKIITRRRQTQCKCPLICEHIDYDVQTTSTPLELNIPTVDPFYEGLEKDDAVVHIFMNSQIYRRVRLDLLSNMVTLVSNLGSAFSLFVGMSMLSVVEIIYYFTVVLHKNYVLEQQARARLKLQVFRQKFKVPKHGMQNN
ncbi:sodium channel protein Nach [Scaptodrosophila lebanonensis]|uniref:Sodium channel protein Nach n=1 Tax=Drosophila lebanonensis TaxID=7225 RepID=A0A6J2UJH8_DROLE|nr:sodium channel protein Nach [Scaptodrosophila lebanonensis]